MFQTNFQMIKPGYSTVVVVTPPRGTWTNQGRVAPSTSPRTLPPRPLPSAPGGWQPAIHLDSCTRRQRDLLLIYRDIYIQKLNYLSRIYKIKF